MISLPFTSLSPQQQAQAARIFRDAEFGTDPNGYDYAIENATGALTGKRCKLGEIQFRQQLGKHVPLYIVTSGQVVLPNQSAKAFAQLLLLDLLKDNASTIGSEVTDPSSEPTEAGPLTRSDLPVAVPSLRPSGWETAGENI